jgi:hypothetical protein
MKSKKQLGVQQKKMITARDEDRRFRKLETEFMNSIPAVTAPQAG